MIGSFRHILNVSQRNRKCFIRICETAGNFLGDGEHQISDHKSGWDIYAFDAILICITGMIDINHLLKICVRQHGCRIGTFLGAGSDWPSFPLDPNGNVVTCQRHFAVCLAVFHNSFFGSIHRFSAKCKSERIRFFIGMFFSVEDHFFCRTSCCDLNICLPDRIKLIDFSFGQVFIVGVDLVINRKALSCSICLSIPSNQGIMFTGESSTLYCKVDRCIHRDDLGIFLRSAIHRSSISMKDDCC